MNTALSCNRRRQHTCCSTTTNYTHTVLYGYHEEIGIRSRLLSLRKTLLYIAFNHFDNFKCVVVDVDFTKFYEGDMSFDENECMFSHVWVVEVVAYGG